MTEIQKRLFALQDPDFRLFQCRLIPTLAPERVIGVRTPELRSLARELGETQIGRTFLTELPHQYLEENTLHGFLIGRCKDFDQTVRLLDRFLPYVDNWATCDQCIPSCFQRHLDELLPCIERWISSGETYTVRFGIGMLMRFYLDERFCTAHLERIAELRSDEYYVNMMIAWFFATALAKQYAAALPYIEERRLAAWTHNKAIQKAVESDRIPAERKAGLKRLKIKS